MNKKFFLVLGIGVIALGYIFNLGYAADDYGMVKNSLSLSIIAQSGSSGDGSGSGSGSGSSSEEEIEWICSICGKDEDHCECFAGITCGATGGPCWRNNGKICFIGEGTYFYAKFTGESWDYDPNTCSTYKFN